MDAERETKRHDTEDENEPNEVRPRGDIFGRMRFQIERTSLHLLLSSEKRMRGINGDIESGNITSVVFG